MSISVSSLPRNGLVSDVFSQSPELSIDKKKELDQPISQIIDLLPLENESQTNSVDIQNWMQKSLQIMSYDKREKIIEYSEEIVSYIDNEEIKSLLNSELEGVKKELKDGVSIDRLLELLFALLLLVGNANIERNISGAKLAEISTLQAKAAGEKGINAAYANLGGAVTGAALGTAITVSGLVQYSKGTSNLASNVETNVQNVDRNRQMNTALNNALRRHADPLTGKSPQERLDKLDTAKGKVAIAPNQSHLTSEEQHTLQQVANRYEVTAASQDASRRVNEFLYGRQQVSGQAIMQIGQHMVPIGQAGFGMQAASANAQAKVNDAEGAVASTVQHSDEQAAQRASELVTKIFTIISSCTDEANRAVGQLSQAIKA